MDRRHQAALSARRPIALTIAGSDSGGGAGIQADLKTFAALGVYGASAVTAVTAQNTLGVSAVHAVPADVVAAQIDAVLQDFHVAAIKIGMLANAGIVEAVADHLPSPWGEGSGVRGSDVSGSAPDDATLASARSVRPLPDRSRRGPSPPAPLPGGEGRAFVIYDPVLAASSGDPLAAAGFVDAIKARLLPLVDCLTPNLPEAAALLAATPAENEAEMIEQGRALLAFGPGAVLMKGGHLAGGEAVDLLMTQGAVRRFAAPKIDSPNTHGTGCTLSSAIAASTVLGLDLPEAVVAAKALVWGAIETGRLVKLGAGPGPLIQIALKT